jgi:hypothetical protein
MHTASQFRNFCFPVFYLKALQLKYNSRKQTALAYFDVLFRHSLGWSKGNWESLQSVRVYSFSGPVSCVTLHNMQAGLGGYNTVQSSSWVLTFLLSHIFIAEAKDGDSELVEMLVAIYMSTRGRNRITRSKSAPPWIPLISCSQHIGPSN